MTSRRSNTQPRSRPERAEPGFGEVQRPAGVTQAVPGSAGGPARKAVGGPDPLLPRAPSQALRARAGPAYAGERARAGRGGARAGPLRGGGRGAGGTEGLPAAAARARPTSRDVRAHRRLPPAAAPGPGAGCASAAAAVGAAVGRRRRARGRLGPGAGGGGGRAPRGRRRGRAGPARQAPVHGRHVHARHPERRALRHVLRALVTGRAARLGLRGCGSGPGPHYPRGGRGAAAWGRPARG